MLVTLKCEIWCTWAMWDVCCCHSDMFILANYLSEVRRWVLSSAQVWERPHCIPHHCKTILFGQQPAKGVSPRIQDQSCTCSLFSSVIRRFRRKPKRCDTELLLTAPGKAGCCSLWQSLCILCYLLLCFPRPTLPEGQSNYSGQSIDKIKIHEMLWRHNYVLFH